MFGNNKIKMLENQVKTYEAYIKPLEELVREIRAKQHEFDNHMNAILNMHYSIDNYDELVKAQSEYIKEVYGRDSRQLLSLLKISDKILAGFLYSKIVSVSDTIKINVDVRDIDVISSVSEYALIEIVGTLVDNAIEACDKENNIIEIQLDSNKNKLIFIIRNMVDSIKMDDVANFFKKGYSTKESKSGFATERGMGLYNAKKLTAKYGGKLTVSLENTDNKMFIEFRLEI